MMSIPEYPLYATHQPILAATLARTAGPVLELGCGNGSTPLLHEVCAAQCRTLWTVESDAAWYAWAERYRTARHTVELVDTERLWSPDWRDVLPWGVVFVDHGDAAGRGRALDVFADAAYPLVVLVHDTGYPDGDALYGITPGRLLKWARSEVYAGLWPHTRVLSNQRSEQ